MSAANLVGESSHKINKNSTKEEIASNTGWCYFISTNVVAF